ncbi:hypothetical protein BV898_07699 [Hypsibius exemplaris]|uniref:Uncharacterized protein n=1 Tax=Hypsibius exemplaris TaxID=2072580 RepID=A0A1W0WSX8_HYPEX|nr:hypothetical protein BV898_07699 [Hypsibius exemplaris]
MNHSVVVKSESAPRTAAAVASPKKKPTVNNRSSDLFMMSGTTAHCRAVFAEHQQHHPQIQLYYVIVGDIVGQPTQKGVLASFTLRDESGDLSCNFAAVDSAKRLQDAVAETDADGGRSVRVVGILKMGFDEAGLQSTNGPYMQVLKVRSESAMTTTRK